MSIFYTTIVGEKTDTVRRMLFTWNASPIEQGRIAMKNVNRGMDRAD